MARSSGGVQDLTYVYEMLDRLQKIAACHAGTDLLVYSLTMAKTETEDLLRDRGMRDRSLFSQDTHIHPARKQ